MREDAIRPWAHRTWVFPRDPRFLEKASRVLDLYHGAWQGKPLGPRDVVLSGDEKTCIQALKRVVPTSPPAPGKPMRVEHEYVRKGVLVYQAALDVRTGKVRGRCVPRNTAVAFHAFVDFVMAREPCKSADRVFWILDNGSAHLPRPFRAWLRERHLKAVPVFLPVHASWLNQVEVYFSIVRDKALTPNDVPDRDTLADRMLRFQRRYSGRARPFRWRFTRRDLRSLLARVAGKG